MTNRLNTGLSHVMLYENRPICVRLGVKLKKYVSGLPASPPWLMLALIMSPEPWVRFISQVALIVSSSVALV